MNIYRTIKVFSVLGIALFSLTGSAAEDFRQEFSRILKVNFKAKDADYRKDYPAALAAVKAVPAPPQDAKQHVKNRYTDSSSNTYAQLLRKLSEIDLTYALAEFEAMKKDGRLLPQHYSVAYRFLMSAAAGTEDRALWDKLWNKFVQLPAKQRKIGDIACLGTFTRDIAQKYFDEYLKKAPALTEKEILELRITFLRSYTWADYEWAKQEFIKLEEYRDKHLPDFKIAVYHYNFLAERAMNHNDFAFAAVCAEKGGNTKVILLLALMNAKSKAESMTALDNAAAKWNQRDTRGLQNLEVLRYLIQNNGDLVKFDTVFAERKFSPKDKLSAIREATNILMDAHCYELARITDLNISKDLFIPVETKYYDVKYTDFAPATAGAWIASKYYNDWKNMETRFFRYSDQYMVSERNDLAHLKGIEQKPLDLAYRTGIHFLADVFGLHIYVRCNDPKMEEVIEGKRDAGSLECYFKPAYNAAYHMWFCNGLPDVKDPHQVDFNAPDSKYALTYDFLKKDAAAAKESAVAHFLIPWEYFISYLPFDGEYWYYGMQRWGAEAVTISGHVHELERMVRLRFAFTPEQKDAVKRNICRKAFNQYSKLRNDQNGSIMAWRTALLGDPAFYENKLLPLLNDLDAAGKEIETADSAALDKLLKEKAPLWQNILYEVDSLRTKDLRESLLAE